MALTFGKRGARYGLNHCRPQAPLNARTTIIRLLQAADKLVVDNMPIPGERAFPLVADNGDRWAIQRHLGGDIMEEAIQHRTRPESFLVETRDHKEEARRRRIGAEGIPMEQPRRHETEFRSEIHVRRRHCHILERAQQRHLRPLVDELGLGHQPRHFLLDE